MKLIFIGIRSMDMCWTHNRTFYFSLLDNRMYNRAPFRRAIMLYYGIFIG